MRMSGLKNRISQRQDAAFGRFQMSRSHSIDRWAQFGVLLTTMLGAITPLASGASTVPPVVVSGIANLPATNVSNPGKVVQDSCGNYYELEAGGALMEIPAGGGAATQIVSYGSWWSGDGLLGGLAIDKSNNLYVGNKWNAQVEKIPSTNCVPNSAAITAVASANGGGALQSVGLYWYDPGDIAVDAAGNIFVHALYGGGLIYEQTAAGAGVLVLGSASGISTITSLATDASGNVFFTATGSGNVYEVPVGSFGTSSPTAVISSGITNAMGVAFDKAGNMYVGDSGAGSIYEVPNSGSALDYASMYLVASGLTITSPITLSSDTLSILLTDSYNSSNIHRLSPGNANLGSVATGSSASATLAVAFNASVTPGSIGTGSVNSAFSLNGGTCTAGTSYSSGQSCTVTAVFTPVIPGSSSTTLNFASSGGSVLAEAYLAGVGKGAALTVDPGAVASLGSGFSSPQGVAVDAAGNVFVADSGAAVIDEFAAGSSTEITLGTSLASPKGVAVDGAGNVFIADSTNNTIVEIPVVDGAPSTAAQTTIIASGTSIAGSALSEPSALAIDGAGNLVIADAGNKRVVFVPFNGSWELSMASAIGSGFKVPSALAFDPAGNIYVADSGNGSVYELALPVTGIAQTTAASGFSSPTGVALDASGSLFVADQGNQLVYRIPNISGTFSASNEVNVTSQLTSSGTPVIATPSGVAVSPAGNVYVTDTVDATVYSVSRTSSTQSGGTISPGNASGALAYSVESAGNSGLIFSTPYETASGDTSQFSVLSSEANACADGVTISAGSSCFVDAEFAPSAYGNYSYTLTLASNTSNTTSAALTFTGTSAATASTTTVIAQTSPTGTPTYDQAVSFSVTVSSADGTPNGSVSLVVDGVTKQTSQVNSSGAATFTLASGVLTGGTHTVTANYLGGTSGFITYSASSSNAISLAVTSVPTSTGLSFTTLYTSPASQPAGTSMTLTATVTSTYAGTPTGTVIFTITDSGGSSTTATAALSSSSSGTQATYLYTPTAPASGTVYDVASVTASYSGDSNFAASSSASSTFDVSSSSGGAGITVNSTSLTTSASTPGSVTFTMTSYGGWTGLVGMACDPSTLPANARCVFSPGQANLFASTTGTVYPTSTVTLTVTVDQPSQTPTASGLPWLGMLFSGVLLLGLRRRVIRLSRALGLPLVLLAALAFSSGLAGLTACTSSGTTKTPSGSTTVRVIASADPFKTGSTTSTQACSSASTYPCFQSTFDITVNVH